MNPYTGTLTACTIAHTRAQREKERKKHEETYREKDKEREALLLIGEGKRFHRAHAAQPFDTAGHRRNIS